MISIDGKMKKKTGWNLFTLMAQHKMRTAADLSRKLAEYGIDNNRHPLHRITPLRRIIERLEPFLHDFQHDDLLAQLQSYAIKHGKPLRQTDEKHLFGGYYRVMVFHA